MEAAAARSCAVFLAQNIWLDGFCSVVSYYEILSLSLKKKQNKTVTTYKTRIRKRLEFSKVIVLG